MIDPSKSTALGDFRGVIEHDRACGHCGYNLKGLEKGGQCPECGNRIPGGGKGGKRRPDTIADAPMSYLRFLARGCLLLAGATFCMVWLGLLGRKLAEDVSPQAVLMCWFGIDIAWLAGIWIVTAPRQTNAQTRISPAMEWRRLRVLNRFTQSLWLAKTSLDFLQLALENAAARAAGVPIGAGVSTGAIELVQVASIIACLIALFGIPFLCAQLESLAEWAQDSSLGNLFRFSAGAIVVGGLAQVLSIIFPAGTIIGWIMNFLVTFAFLFMIVGIIVFFVSVIMLCRMTLWAINNAENAVAREERFAMKMHDEQQALRKLPTPESIPTSHAPVDLVSKGPKTIKVIEKSITAEREYGHNKRRRGKDPTAEMEI